MSRIQPLIFVVSVFLTQAAWAGKYSKKETYIQKLSSCESIGLEKRYFPKEKSLGFYRSDSMSLFYGCVGTDPDTYYFVKDEAAGGNETRFNEELRLFSDLVNYYKMNMNYDLAGSQNLEIKTVIIEKYRFDKKQ